MTPSRALKVAWLVVAACVGPVDSTPAQARGSISTASGKHETTPTLSCVAGSPDNRVRSRKLGMGYEVTVGPASPARAEGEDCTARVVGRQGRIAFEVAGYNVTLDGAATGLDVDGDGHGDVVLRVDSGGGQHCCWSVTVLSLQPSPRKLFEIDAAGLVRFEKDKRGHIIVWQRVPGPADFTDMADRPFAERAFQFRGGRLVDETPQHCGELLAPGNRDFDRQARLLTPERVASLSAEQGQPDQEVASALWSRALQLTFCHRYDDAQKDLDRWPAPQRAYRAMYEAVKDECPDFAKRLLRGAGGERR